MVFINWILLLFCVFSSVAFWKFLYRFVTEGQDKIISNMFFEGDDKSDKNKNIIG